MSVEAMKAALEVLESIGLKTEKMVDAIALLRQALAQPDLAKVGEVGVWGHKREWVGLTQDEVEYELTKEFAQWWSRHVSVCRAIEAKLKEKNA